MLEVVPISSQCNYATLASVINHQWLRPMAFIPHWAFLLQLHKVGRTVHSGPAVCNAGTS
jgi:hypothetical protein